MGKLFLGGVPTEPDVRRLLEEFPQMQIGDELTHEQIESPLGLLRSSSRYRTVTNAWRRKLLLDGVELLAVPGFGFRVLSPSERIDVGVRGVQSGVRKQVRAINRTDRVITDDPIQRKRQEVLHRYGIAIRSEATTALKQLEPPKETRPLPKFAPKIGNAQ